MLFCSKASIITLGCVHTPGVHSRYIHTSNPRPHTPMGVAYYSFVHHVGSGYLEAFLKGLAYFSQVGGMAGRRIGLGCVYTPGVHGKVKQEDQGNLDFLA